MATPTPFETALAAADAGDFAQASAIARALFARRPDDVEGLQIAGYVAFRQGRHREAIAAFINANRIAPAQPRILSWIGILFQHAGDYAQAERAFADAVRIDPRLGEAWCHLGETRYMLGRRDAAREAMEAALAAEPRSATVLSLAARFYETLHEGDRAASLAMEAIRLSPDNEIARITLMDVALRAKEYDAVIKEAAALHDLASGNPRHRARLEYLVATAHDRLGNYAQAFERYEKANALQGSLDRESAATAPSPLHAENLDRIIAYLEATDIGGWKPATPLNGPEPVFLLGFVRSGTTWLEQILSSHPSIAVMEEEDLLIDAWRDLLISDEGLARLCALSEDEINRRRADYWARADRSLHSGRRKIVVDKLPLNTANLPLIWRLFPDAKVLFAIRDPRDAVLSAFQQHFQVNAGMAHFLDLKSAADFYDRIMTVAALARAKSPLLIHDVRYERVVENFDAEIGAILRFLGLDWNDAVRSYQETARRRAVKTPSAKQVIEKPYAASIGKWRRYRAGMAPVLPTLAPWVEKFGYAIE
jgi:tetratricopeptide (TPR) repeat protein